MRPHAVDDLVRELASIARDQDLPGRRDAVQSIVMHDFRLMLAGRISGRVVVMPGTPGETFALYAIDGCGEKIEDGIALLRWLPVPGLTPDPAAGAVTLVAAELARRQIVLRDNFFHSGTIPSYADLTNRFGHPLQSFLLDPDVLFSIDCFRAGCAMAAGMVQVSA